MAASGQFHLSTDRRYAIRTQLDRSHPPTLGSAPNGASERPHPGGIGHSIRVEVVCFAAVVGRVVGRRYRVASVVRGGADGRSL